MGKLISRNSMSAKALVVSQNAAINFIEGKKGNIFFSCGVIERGYVSPALQKTWETATLDDIKYCECSKDGKTFVPCLMTVGDINKYLKKRNIQTNMNYPLISEYIEAIKSAEDNFATLTNLRPVLDDSGNPIMSGGNFAIVFKMKDQHTGKTYAVKCFLREQEGREESYSLISEELRKVKSPYIIPVQYLKNELFVDTAQTDETEFPVLLMDWVEGQTLSSLLQETANNYDENHFLWSEEEEKVALFELNCLPYNFIRTASWLIKQPFAHGDIKPDNIIIKPNGTCVLVDYDGMYVPAMQGMKKQCMGTPNYRYPFVNEQRFDNSLDNYSISIIALSLYAFALKPNRISESDDFCIITEKKASSLHGHYLFNDETLMSDSLFRDLLAIYLHTLSQNKLDSMFFDSCISEFLCPKNYDITTTEVSDSEKESYWEDEYGVRYSLDGRKVICASKELKDVDYTIREGVLTVCDDAFLRKKLHSITLPDSVIAIGATAFGDNFDMEYCNIPSSVRFIADNNPWVCCFNIRKMDCLSPYYLIKDGILYSSDYHTAYGFIYWNSQVIIDSRTKKISGQAFNASEKGYDSLIKKVTLLGDMEIGFAAFSGCKSAIFSINGTITGIGGYAFEDCSKLKEIALSGAVKIVEFGTVNNCTSLEKISFSENLVYISECSLSNCTSLQEINVDTYNSYYCSIDGVLFNKSITKLIKYPAGKTDSEYEIPQSVYEICEEAFANCESIEVIKSNSKIKSFGREVFHNCSNLRRCNIQIDESADAESSWNLSGLFFLKNADSETKKNGYNGLLKAATMGLSYAQFYLARCYEEGTGVDVDLHKAKEYYTLAKNHKYEDAAEALDRVERKLKDTANDLPF